MTKAAVDALVCTCCGNWKIVGQPGIEGGRPFYRIFGYGTNVRDVTSIEEIAVILIDYGMTLDRFAASA